MNIVPFGKFVLVRLLEEAKSASGLDFTTNTIPDSKRGYIEAVGPEVKYCKEKDIVVFHHYAGVEVGEDYKVLAEEELLGKEI
jgi:co-chaperonin GroES (HSP10)